MRDMKKKAEDILEDYANSYSQVDLESLEKFLNQIRVEAIKEFAERLKEKAPNITEERFHILQNIIDNLVKEMVGAE
jgi:hypothetical protein